MAIWVFKDGAREGPYEDDDVRELIYEGTYSGSEQAMRDGDSAMRSLDEILAGEQSQPPPPLPEEMPGENAGYELSIPAEPPPLPDPAPAPPAEVRIVDIRMPFGSMVVFLIKLLFASIPAMIIVAAITIAVWLGVLTFAAAFLAALMHHHH